MRFTIYATALLAAMKWIGVLPAHWYWVGAPIVMWGLYRATGLLIDWLSRFLEDYYR